MKGYRISQPEAYGCAGAYGNKYWINIHDGSEEEVEKVLGYVLKTCRKDRVVFSIGSYKPMDVTFFVYTNPEKESGVDAADLVYEWDEKEGLVKAE